MGSSDSAVLGGVGDTVEPATTTEVVMGYVPDVVGVARAAVAAAERRLLLDGALRTT